MGLAVLIGISFLSVSCQRNSRTVWEDTKTGVNYMGVGLKSVAGKHGGSKALKHSNEFVGPAEDEYIPLRDNDLYQKLVMQDAETLDKITTYSALPQSKTVPGEKGSSLPGIEHFLSADEMNMGEIFQNINFATNEYVVRRQENFDKIRKIAAYLKNNSDVYIFIEGHCDERGTATYNQSLGLRRSNSVRALLVKEGVNIENVFTISYGYEKPLALGHSENIWKINRRSQFKLYKVGQ